MRKTAEFLTKHQVIMSNYSEVERRCAISFDSCGEIYHAYTSGKETPILFASDDDMAFAMNVIAYAAFTFGESIKIIAFALMNNHFHFVIQGTKSEINGFFQCITKKLKYTVPLAGNLRLSLKPILDLGGMRNTIAYVNRNGYVADSNYTPFSYPWSTGRYYFNDISSKETYSAESFEQKRRMLRGRAVNFPSDWQVIDGYISPQSYCAIKFGMVMFRDAHHYFMAVSKNVEAYSGIAVEIGDGEFLTDSELFTKVLQIVRDEYRLPSIRNLTGAQRLDLARTLRYDYRSSNGQIRRVLGLSQYEVDSLFPRGE